MNLAICSLASGSSGNCYLVRSEKTALLIDAGISAKQITERLKVFGLGVRDISAVLVTHEHSDHIKGLGTLAKNKDLNIYATAKTFRGCEIDFGEAKLVSFDAGQSFNIGDIEVSSFSVSHDAADPVGYYFQKDDAKLSIVTDTGKITEQIKTAIRNANILVMESNHDESILKMGRYPWFLKQRILGDKGHLSNEAASEALAEIFSQEKNQDLLKQKIVLLAHLSKENNFPEMAIMTMQNTLQASGLIINREVIVEALPRTQAGKDYVI